MNEETFAWNEKVSINKIMYNPGSEAASELFKESTMFFLIYLIELLARFSHIVEDLARSKFFSNLFCKGLKAADDVLSADSVHVHEGTTLKD